MLSPQRGVSMFAGGSKTNSVFKNDDRCNVKKEAISRGVEDASKEKAVSLQDNAIDTNQRESTTCSRVWKIRNQDSAKFGSRFGQHSVKVCPPSTES
jgi:hypothetical protein